MKYSFLSNNFGFTFLELMTAVSIVVIVLSISVINYKGSNKRAEVILWADKLVSDIRLMENYALSVRTLNDDSARNVWGIYLKIDSDNQGHYILFNDANDDKKYQSGEVYRDIMLPDKIIISNITGYYGSTGKEAIEELSLAFVPPDPQVSIIKHNLPTREYDKVVIELTDDLNGSHKEITVNDFGLVEVTK